MKLKIDWPTVSQATSYDVEITRNSTVQPIVNVTTNTYEQDNPPPGSYSVRVRAVNLAGASPWSNTAQGPGLPPAPQTPTITVIP